MASKVNGDFTLKLNPLTNKMEWLVKDEDYDYHQEIATSSYADMLHDDERNKKFGQALKKAIDKMHNMGRKAHVLDIGTGTGLLSMLAAKYGADSVVACEAFFPMANCAVNIIEQNHYSGQIKVVKKHSTALTVGVDGDLQHKANILVSEVFDTELIGEGAIKTFNHAHQHLLEVNCIVIPDSGTVYAQVVESHLASSWNNLQEWKYKDQVIVNIPDDIKQCHGAAAVHDIQLSQFPQSQFNIISPVLPVFKFDWSGRQSIETRRHNCSSFKPLCQGKGQVVFMWWDLNMDQDGDIVLGCAPFWNHPDAQLEKNTEVRGNPAKSIPWRDHWMQAVYFLPNNFTLDSSKSYTLVSHHDEFSLWFHLVDEDNAAEDELPSSSPICTCHFHVMLSRTRVGAVNDAYRRLHLMEALTTLVKPSTVCLAVGDASLLGLAAARLTNKVYLLDDHISYQNVLKNIARFNELKVNLCSDVKDAWNKMVTSGDSLEDVVIVAEPFFRNSILPWNNIHLWYVYQEFRRLSSKINVKVSPGRCYIRACAVQFDDLWKINSRLNECEGFNMSMFDKLIESAKRKAESSTEAQPLWEYPCKAVSSPATLLELHLDQQLPSSKLHGTGTWVFQQNHLCDGVALWLDYELSPGNVVSCGPVEPVVVGQYIHWDMFERQAVHLFRIRHCVNKGDVLNYAAHFYPDEADFDFTFQFTR